MCIAHARTTSRPMPQLGKGNARLPAPSLVGAIVIPCANPPVPVASLLAAEPVVTTRRSSVPTRSYVALAQVMAPSDGLPDPSSLAGRAMRLVNSSAHRGSSNKRRNGAPTNPGSRVQVAGTTPHREHPRRQEPRAAVASNKTNGTNREWCLPRPSKISPRSGVVRRTETLSRPDRHQPQRSETEPAEEMMQDIELRTEATLQTQSRRELCHPSQPGTHPDAHRQPAAGNGLRQHACPEPESQARREAGGTLAGGRVKRRHPQESDVHPALVGGEERQGQRRRQEQRRVRHCRPALRHQRQQSPPADLRRSRPGHRSVHAHVAPAASGIRPAARRVAQDPAGVGGPRRHLAAQGQLGAKAVAPARSRSAMPSNAKSWTRRSALPARAV